MSSSLANRSCSVATASRVDCEVGAADEAVLTNQHCPFMLIKRRV